MLDVVAITLALPENGVKKGAVGTVLEVLDAETVLVEFADLDGKAYALLPVSIGSLMALHHDPAIAA